MAKSKALPGPRTRRLVARTRIPALLAGLSDLQSAGLRIERRETSVKFDWGGTEVVVRERYGTHPRPRLDAWAVFPYPDWLQARLKDEGMEVGFATGESACSDLRAKIEKAGYLREEVFNHDMCEGFFYEWGTGIRVYAPSEVLIKAGMLRESIRRFLRDVIEFRREFDEKSSKID